MKTVYAASGTQRRVLKNVPKSADCLPVGDGKALGNLAGTIVYLWFGKSGCWYDLREMQSGRLYGYALAGGWWRYAPVELRRVRRYS
jgi:hypothetical protein